MRSPFSFLRKPASGGTQNTGPVFVDIEGQNNARLGVVYLFSKIDPAPNVISVAIDGILGIASQGMDGVGKGVVDMVKPIATTTGGAIEKVAWKESYGSGGSGALDSAAAFKAWAADLLQKIVAEVKAKFKEPKFVVGELKGLIVGFLRIFAKEVVPYVKGALDIVKGLAKATPLIVQRVRTWIHERATQLVEGHGAIMVKSLKTAMTLSIFEGLYIAIKGAVDIALTTVTAGAATIAKIVIAFAEAAVKIVWRMFELFKLDDFCSWCRTAYGLRDTPNAPHKNAQMFATTYRKYAMAVPVIAALTLNSGICGDKMRFIQLFDTADLSANQRSFDAGVALIDGLKPFSGLLLRNMGVSFVITDAFVKKLVDVAKAEPVPMTTGGKVLKFVNDVLTY